jgi:hypothetical protein
MPVSHHNAPPKLRSLRNLLIHPKFQLPIILTNLAVLFIFFSIAWIGTRNAFMDLKPIAGLSGMEAEFFKKYVDYQAAQIERALYLALGSGIVAAAGITLIITHRLAGPLVRLKSYFQSIIDGKPPIRPLEFRDGDFLRDMEPLVNKAIEKVQDQARQKSA